MSPVIAKLLHAHIDTSRAIHALAKPRTITQFEAVVYYHAQEVVNTLAADICERLDKGADMEAGEYAVEMNSDGLLTLCPTEDILTGRRAYNSPHYVGPAAAELNRAVRRHARARA